MIRPFIVFHLAGMHVASPVKVGFEVFFHVDLIKIIVDPDYGIPGLSWPPLFHGVTRFQPSPPALRKAGSLSR